MACGWLPGFLSVARGAWVYGCERGAWAALDVGAERAGGADRVIGAGADRAGGAWRDVADDGRGAGAEVTRGAGAGAEARGAGDEALGAGDDALGAGAERAPEAPEDPGDLVPPR